MLSDLSDDLALMRDAVAEAGDVARDIFEKGFDTWRKEAHEPVTDVDIAVDKHLKARLQTGRAGYGWLSEETRDDRSRFTAPRTWVVDPIDGTRAMLQGKPHFAISVALVAANHPVAGVIYNPATDEWFEAMAGGGAHYNGAPATIGDRGTIEGCRILAYKEFIASRRWRTPWPAVETGMVNSIAYRLMSLVAGRYDAVLTTNGKSDWDLAAAALIVQEAGGTCSDATGVPFAFNKETVRHPSVLAAGPELHARLVEKMRDWAPSQK